MTLEKINGGVIHLDGEPLTHMNENSKMIEASEKYLRERRSKIGMVFQQFNLFPHMTALQNCIEAPIEVLGLKKEEAEERALDLLCKRSLERVAFGKQLAELGGNYDVIADCRMEIEMCRLLTYRAADRMDKLGNKIAKSDIAQIKVAVPKMALSVIDKAIQIHGGGGVSQDTPLARMYAGMRTLRLADGPDEVHRRTVARIELSKHQAAQANVKDITSKSAQG